MVGNWRLARLLKAMCVVFASVLVSAHDIPARAVEIFDAPPPVDEWSDGTFNVSTLPAEPASFDTDPAGPAPENLPSNGGQWIATPEPSAFVILLTSMASMAMLARRRRRRC